MVNLDAASDGSGYRGHVAQVAVYKFDVEAVQGGVIAAFPYKGPHGMAVVEQPPDEIGPEMTAGSCDEYHRRLYLRQDSTAVTSGGVREDIVHLKSEIRNIRLDSLWAIG